MKKVINRIRSQNGTTYSFKTVDRKPLGTEPWNAVNAGGQVIYKGKFGTIASGIGAAVSEVREITGTLGKRHCH